MISDLVPSVLDYWVDQARSDGATCHLKVWFSGDDNPFNVVPTMRIKKFTNYITEAKNLHMEHLEDSLSTRSKPVWVKRFDSQRVSLIC